MKSPHTNLFKTYFYLTKPGIVLGNLITCAAGFFVGAAGTINVWTLLAVLSGTGLAIASACVLNNYLDRGIDAKMERTKNRASVTGAVNVKAALIYASVLGIAGLAIMYQYTNILTIFVGAVGAFFYVVLYSIWKRKSVFSTIIGSVSGAAPLVAGYTAAVNRFDAGAVILFLFMVCWQMPHFYAIGIFRLKDYKAAMIPILPVKKGIRETKIHMIIYIVLFIVVSSSLTFFGYEGMFYLLLAVVMGIYWLILGIQGFKSVDDKKWAKNMFKFSLILLTVLCVIMSVDCIK